MPFPSFNLESLTNTSPFAATAICLAPPSASAITDALKPAGTLIFAGIGIGDFAFVKESEDLADVEASNKRETKIGATDFIAFMANRNFKQGKGVQDITNSGI